MDLIEMQHNGTKKGLNEKVITFVLSLATSLIAGCFIFLWNVNASLIRLQERELERDKAIDDLNIKINNIQLDIRELRDKVIRIESAQKR